MTVRLALVVSFVATTVLVAGGIVLQEPTVKQIHVWQMMASSDSLNDKNKRPNIVLITVDDMRVDELQYMPHVRRLIADKGSQFNRAYSTYPLCCPARTSMMTGQYAHNHGVMGNITRQRGGYYYFKKHANPRNTLGVWMQDAGYETSLIGKFLNRYGEKDPREVPPGWTSWAGIPGMGAYRFMDQRFNIDSELVRMKGHNTKVVTQLAMERMRVSAPFFTWVSYLAPHDEWRGKKTWSSPRPLRVDRSRRVGPSPLVVEYSTADKPRFIQRLAALGPRALRVIEANRRARARSLMGVDRQVARIVKHLKSQKLLRETVIIFNSDNGYALGEHNITHGKTQPYEHVTRVPLMMRGPDVPVGETKHFVALHDIVPTILQLTGAEAGRVQDGVSLLATARHPRLHRGRPMLYESGNTLGTLGAIATTAVGKRFFTAIHAGRWVYIRYVTGDEELYNLYRDPNQLRSLHAKPSLGAIKRQLARKLATLRNCEGKECNTSFQLKYR